MLKITDAVLEILKTDEVALEAIRRGWLNLSAYAKHIHPQVEEKTWKEVKLSTIVVSLSRLVSQLDEMPPLHPPVVLDDVSIKSPLIDISYDKTAENLKSLRTLQQSLSGNTNHFVMVTQGTREITIIVPAELKESILKNFSSAPKDIFENLVGISVSFAQEYLKVPNVIYTVLSAVAGQRINLREIVSTYTEISMIIDRNEMQKAIQALQPFLGKKSNLQ